MDAPEPGENLLAPLLERLRAADKLVEGPRANFDTEYVKYMLDRMMAEAGVEVRLFTTVIEADAEGRFVRQ